MDLNADCLVEVFRHLSKLDLCAVRETHPRFIQPAEYCFKKKFATNGLALNRFSVDSIKKCIEYFGRFLHSVTVNDYLVRAIESESITKQFLLENMPNVNRIRIGGVAKKNIHFISAWNNVEMMEIYRFQDMDDQLYWPKLTTLRVYDFDYADELVEFLKSHGNIQELYLRGNSSFRTAKLFETIANNLQSLVSLDIGDVPRSRYSSLVFGLSNLESLVIKMDQTMNALKNLKKLKRLEICNEISLQSLNDLVEYVPTLNYLKLRDKVQFVFNKKAADDLIARRVLHLAPGNEKLILDFDVYECSGADDQNVDRTHFAAVKNIESKYVSGIYLDIGDDDCAVSSAITRGYNPSQLRIK